MFNDLEIPEQVKKQGFTLPKAYKRIVDLSLVDLEPWYFLTGDECRHLFEGLANRYKDKILLPYARRQDCDDVACFVIKNPQYQPGTVMIIHDYATPGYEVDAVFPSFWDWFREAVNEMISWSETDSQNH